MKNISLGRKERKQFFLYIYPLLPSYIFDNKHIPLNFFYKEKKLSKKHAL